jgi:hypothetical protein
VADFVAKVAVKSVSADNLFWGRSETLVPPAHVRAAALMRWNQRFATQP